MVPLCFRILYCLLKKAVHNFNGLSWKSNKVVESIVVNNGFKYFEYC